MSQSGFEEMSDECQGAGVGEEPKPLRPPQGEAHHGHLHGVGGGAAQGGPMPHKVVL